MRLVGVRIYRVKVSNPPGSWKDKPKTRVSTTRGIWRRLDVGGLNDPADGQNGWLDEQEAHIRPGTVGKAAQSRENIEHYCVGPNTPPALPTMKLNFTVSAPLQLYHEQ